MQLMTGTLYGGCLPHPRTELPADESALADLFLDVVNQCGPWKGQAAQYLASLGFKNNEPMVVLAVHEHRRGKIPASNMQSV